MQYFREYSMDILGKRNHELRENNEGLNFILFQPSNCPTMNTLQGPDQLDYSEDEEEGDDIPRRHSEKNSRPKGQLETNDNGGVSIYFASRGSVPRLSMHFLLDYSEAEERSDDLPLRHPKKRVYSRKRLEASKFSIYSTSRGYICGI